MCAWVSMSVSPLVELHVDLSLIHSCALLSSVTELLRALDHPSNSLALAQDCNNVELHLSPLVVDI